MSIDESIKDSILRNIGLSGSAEEKTSIIKPIIASSEHLNAILNLSSGSARIHSHINKKFNLILAQPNGLSVLNPFEIRCCLCRAVISYPCWYYGIRYAVNHIHYFVCFDEADVSKPLTRCYRKG